MISNLKSSTSILLKLIFTPAIVVLFIFTSSILSKNVAYAYPDNCSINIYPKPTVGTNKYKFSVKYMGSSKLSFVFLNIYSLDSSILSIIPPSNWYSKTAGGTYATGIASDDYEIKNNQVISWDSDISIPTMWDGLDIGAFDNSLDTSPEHIRCGGHYLPEEITYNDLDSINLNVPVVKQTDPIWTDDIYDHASLWSPKRPSIGTWGCALTSASMVLNYHGLFKLPDSAVITPGTLNTWLKSQKDGYVRNGEVNWLAISRLSKLAKQSGYNENFHFDALEFNRLGSNSKDQMTNDLTDGIPDILEVPGHFVVARGKDSNSIYINDPYYNRLTLNDGYNNQYISLDRFVPSNTDLSNLFIVGDDNLLFNLNNNLALSVCDIFTQTPIQDPTVSNKFNDSPLSELLYQKPPTGDYRLEIQGKNNSIYKLDTYEYDSNGEPKLQSITGLIGQGKKEILLIHYDKDDQAHSSVVKLVTSSSLKEDIQEAIDLKKIDKTFGKNLLSQVKSIDSLIMKKNSTLVNIRLRALQLEISLAKGSLIQSDVYIIISNDITSLINTKY
ncbi:hypothetical protein BH09PAT1_BH09PAT1_5930 [soil metagenome]